MGPAQGLSPKPYDQTGHGGPLISSAETALARNPGLEPLGETTGLPPTHFFRVWALLPVGENLDAAKLKRRATRKSGPAGGNLSGTAGEEGWSMSAKTKIAAAAVAVFIATPHAAGALLPLPHPPALAGEGKGGEQQRSGNVMSKAYCAANNKSRRAPRPTSRGRVSQAADPSIRAKAPDGRDLGTDPDATIRFQLRRDSAMGGM